MSVATISLNLVMFVTRLHVPPASTKILPCFQGRSTKHCHKTQSLTAQGRDWLCTRYITTAVRQAQAMIYLPSTLAWKINSPQKPEVFWLGLTLPVWGFLQSDQPWDRLNLKHGVILVLLMWHPGRMISFCVPQDFRPV